MSARPLDGVRLASIAARSGFASGSPGGVSSPASVPPDSATSNSWSLRKDTRRSPISWRPCTTASWFIEEAGDRDPSGARFGAMLQVMLARTPHLAAPDIVAWLPDTLTPPQVSRTDSHPTAEVMMIRPLKDRTLPLPPLDARQVAYWHSDYF